VLYEISCVNRDINPSARHKKLLGRWFWFV